MYIGTTLMVCRNALNLKDINETLAFIGCRTNGPSDYREDPIQVLASPVVLIYQEFKIKNVLMNVNNNLMNSITINTMIVFCNKLC